MWLGRLIGSVALAALAGCGGDSAPTASDPAQPALLPIILQADWYAEPEHGGFYLALLNGYYREAGLDVEIRPLTAMSSIYSVVASGQAQFGMGTSDNLLIARAQEIPLRAVFPYFQHDPQGVMVHKASGITSLQQLDGRDVMISPVLHYVDFLEKGLGIHMNLLPVDGGVGRFIANADYAQQVFLTNEPYLAMQAGADPYVMPFWDTGYDPYRLVFTSEKFAAEHPEAVAAFISATERGWREFLAEGDHSAVFTEIARLNPAQNADSMAWTYDQMQHYSLGYGNSSNGETLGRLSHARLQTQVDQLQQLGLLGAAITADDILLPELYPAGQLVQ